MKTVDEIKNKIIERIETNKILLNISNDEVLINYYKGVINELEEILNFTK